MESTSPSITPEPKVRDRADNNLFFVGPYNNLRSKRPLDYEANATLLVRLKVTDEHNATLERKFVINLLNDPADDPVVPDETYASPEGNYTTPEDDYDSPDGNYVSPVDHYHSPDGNYTPRSPRIITRHRAMHTTLRMETSILQVMAMILLIPISLRQQILSKRLIRIIRAQTALTPHQMPGIFPQRKLTILPKGTTQLQVMSMLFQVINLRHPTLAMSLPKIIT